jgi:hypothetical protein
MKTHFRTGWWLPLALLALSCKPTRRAADDSNQTTPVPVVPTSVEQMEEKSSATNDFRTPIMPRFRPGEMQTACDNPPSEREVLRSVAGAEGDAASNCDDCNIALEQIVDKIDPPRFYPLIGPAQLHHCHWKCTVYYTATVRVDYLVHFTLKTRRVQVLYIDKDHLHQFFGPAAAEAPDEDEIERLLEQSESYRQLREEWLRFWPTK